YRVQMPFSPRKGGIPLSAEIPAPVNATVYKELRNNSAASIILFITFIVNQTPVKVVGYAITRNAPQYDIAYVEVRHDTYHHMKLNRPESNKISRYKAFSFHFIMIVADILTVINSRH
ncbi:MAG TPA: hypothetical protein VMW01_00675, partial [Williamwhitmania sp.]|nr:hypothetical protein [Williamwhitmania sp.]